MKKIIFSLLFSIIIGNAFSQCNDVLIDSAQKKLDGATYMNAFRVLLKKGKKSKVPVANFKVQMNKGNIYRFVVSEDEANNTPLIAVLSDDYRKYGESYDKFEQVNYKGFDFRCTKTGYYYISGFFKDGEKGCGVIVMSLLKVQNQYIR